MPIALVLMPQVSEPFRGGTRIRPKYHRPRGEVFELRNGVVAAIIETDQATLDTIAADPQCRVVGEARTEQLIDSDLRDRVAEFEARVRAKWAIRAAR